MVGKWRHRELEAAGNMVLLQEEEDNECFCSVNCLFVRSRGQVQAMVLPAFTLVLPTPVNSIKISPPKWRQLLISQMVLDFSKLTTIINP